MSLSLVGISPTKDRGLHPLYRQCSMTWNNEAPLKTETHTSESARFFIFLSYLLNSKDAQLENVAQPGNDQELVRYIPSKSSCELPTITVNSAFNPASFLFQLARGHDFGSFGHQKRTDTSVLVPIKSRKALQSSEGQQAEVVVSESNGPPQYRTATKVSIVNPGQVSIKTLKARYELRSKNASTVRPRYAPNLGQSRDWDKRRSGGCKAFSELTDAMSALACLRTFTRCTLTDKPELIELFDQWLTYATEKIENESEKHKATKAQLVAAKDEIKSQGVIISGLFRERHSVQITPDDSALVLTLRETIEDMKKKEARMSCQIEKLGTKLADRRQTYSIFPNSIKSTSSLDQRSSKHSASTNSLSQSDRLSYQSIPSSSTSIRSGSRRSQSSKAESEPKHKSRQAAREPLPEDESHVTQALRKKLQAERQLILALEEAVTDLEANVKELLSECDHWKQQSAQLQTKVDEYKHTIASHESNIRRLDAVNDCQRTLSQRMQFFNKGPKKKRGFNCL